MLSLHSLLSLFREEDRVGPNRPSSNGPNYGPNVSGVSLRLLVSWTPHLLLDHVYGPTNDGFPNLPSFATLDEPRYMFNEPGGPVSSLQKLNPQNGSLSTWMRARRDVRIEKLRLWCRLKT